MAHDHDHDGFHEHEHVHGSESASEKAMLEQAQAKMRSLFANMPHDLPLYLFASHFSQRFWDFDFISREKISGVKFNNL